MSTLSRTRRLVRGAVLAISLACLALGGGAMAADFDAPPAALPSSSGSLARPGAAPAATPADASVSAGYAQREQQEAAALLASFQGGDTVIIGTSAVVVALVVLLLIVLL